MDDERPQSAPAATGRTGLWGVGPLGGLWFLAAALTLAYFCAFPRWRVLIPGSSGSRLAAAVQLDRAPWWAPPAVPSWVTTLVPAPVAGPFPVVVDWRNLFLDLLFVAGFFGIGAFFWPRTFWRARLTARRRAENRCLACGYDLRATPGRCPECGAWPATTPADVATPSPASRASP